MEGLPRQTQLTAVIVGQFAVDEFQVEFRIDAVELVTHHGIAQRGQRGADLVGSPCGKRRLHKGDAIMPPKANKVRLRPFRGR